MLGRLRLGTLLCLLGAGGLGGWAQSGPRAGQASRTEARFAEIERSASLAFGDSRFPDATRLYSQAVRLRPRWAEGWGYLAAAEFSQEHYAKAKAAYHQTTLLTPQNGPSWAYLGFCEYELRDYRNAVAHLMKGRQLGLGHDPDLLSKVGYEVAMLWNTAGQFEMGGKELTFFAKAGDQHPAVIEATGLNVLRMPLFPYEIPKAKQDLVLKAGEAGWNMNGGHIEEARRLYAELVAAYPREPNLHYAYGFVVAASDQEAGIVELEKELAISPGHVPAMVEGALLNLELGHLEKSETLARRAMQLEPKNYAPHNLLGRILMQKGAAALAIQELEAAVRLAPGVPVAHFNLGQAYQKSGRSAAAAREFAAFRKLSPGQEGRDAGDKAIP